MFVDAREITKGAMVNSDVCIIGAGAKFIGPIHVGDDCHIGGNAVVRTSVPPHCVAVGVPAVIKEKHARQRSEVACL